MKKLLFFAVSIVIAVTLAVTAYGMDEVLTGWTPESTEYAPLERGDDVIARIVIGSDVHIGYGYASEKLQNAYDSIGKLGGADAFVLAGDLTNMGRVAQFEELFRIVSKNSAELTVDVEGFTGKGAGAGAPVDTTIMELGNHEFYDAGTDKAYERFETIIGQDLDKLYWIEGRVPVIKISMTSATYKDNYVTKHEFIEKSLKEIEESGWTGHIFLVSHMATGGSMIGAPSASDEPFAKETIELLKKYPQLIHVSGHSHQITYNPSFIDQSLGFTCITDGIVGEDFGNEVYFGSTAVIFDVKTDGTTEIHRVDFQNARLLYDDEDWTLDSSDKPEDFIYFATKSEATNPDSYSLKGSAPSFPADAWVKAEDLGNNDSIKVTFTSNATPASDYNYDYIRRYRVRAVPVNGMGVTVTKYVNNDMHKPQADRAKTMFATLIGLDWDTEYRIEVTALTSFGVGSNKITSAENYNVGKPVLGDVECLYDIDYTYGITDDQMGHAKDVPGYISFAKDETLGRTVMVSKAFGTSRYAVTRAEVDKTRETLSLEVLVNLADIGEKQEIVGMLGSFSLSLGVEDGELYVLTHTYATEHVYVCRTPVAEGEWVHIAVTYDCKDMRVYINGELKSTERSPGGLQVDYDEANTEDNYVYVGGRRSTGVDSYLLSRGSMINYVKVYAGILSEDNIKTSYEESKTPAKEIPFTDIKSGSWYYSSVVYSYVNGLMNGTSDTTFAPSTKTSRAMIVQMLYNMEGAPEVEYKPIFTDVKEKNWFAKAVIWAYENGVTSGSSATTFSPNTLVTREQVAVFLYRYLKDYKKAEMIDGADLSVYPDEGKISKYAGFREAVAWANATGIVGGKKSGDAVTLAPLDKAMRSETATMFARFHRSYAK